MRPPAFRPPSSRSPGEPAGGAASDSLTNYELLVGVCGGIAAYKTAELVSACVQRGAGVTVVMTRHARQFVGPTTFRALTGRPVLTSMWHGPDSHAMEHLHPAERADLFIVAPATANILGKLAGGIADDLLSTLLLAADSPVLMAPAMNTRMWEHPAVQRNANLVCEMGVHMVGPEDGWLACGVSGPGRMSAPQAILAAATALLVQRPPKAG